MSDLLDRLGQVQPESLPSCLDRIESIAIELDPAELYPEDEIVNRVLGTSIRLEDPRQLVGAAILTDLSVLAECVSHQIGMTVDDLLPGALDLEQLLSRWSVSKKTVERYRRCGLIARRVRDEHRRTRVMFTQTTVEGFERRHADRVGRASRFRRLSGPEDEKIQRLAARYHHRLRWSLNKTARRIAERYGLSHEGVRQILKRARETGAVFGEAGPPSERDRVFAVRAARRGVVGSPECVAARWGRSKPSARRAFNEGRADLLRAVRLTGPVLPTFAREAAEEVILGVPPVRSGLGVPGILEVEEMLLSARKRTPPIENEETSRVVGVHYLRWRAGERIAGLNTTTASGTSLDLIETDLRWVSLLKGELVRPHLGLIVETLESRAGCALNELGLAAFTRWWGIGTHAASVAVDGFDPSGKGRLAGRIGLGVDRAVSELSKHTAPERSRARRAVPRGVRIRDWTLTLDPWQRWLGIDPRVRSVLPGLTERSRRVLALRCGLAGGGEGSGSLAEPPRTLEQTAGAIGTARVHAARFEREAITEALERFRQDSGSDVP